MKGLIWQDDENTIDVVYQTIYGLPVREAIQVIKKYQEKQLISKEWIIKWECGFLNPNGEHRRVIKEMLQDWEKENGTI